MSPGEIERFEEWVGPWRRSIFELFPGFVPDPGTTAREPTLAELVDKLSEEEVDLWEPQWSRSPSGDLCGGSYTEEWIVLQRGETDKYGVKASAQTNQKTVRHWYFADGPTPKSGDTPYQVTVRDGRT